MRVLVTGFAGYIGPVVVRRLIEAGHTVVGVDLMWYVNQHAADMTWPKVSFRGDIRRPADAWYADVDAVVHLAGLSNDPIGDLDPDVTNDHNFLGTCAALRPGVRNLVVSSCSVYGATPELATEATETRPLTAYARAKASVDSWLHQVAPRVGITDWVSLRLGTVYGYSPGHRLDLVVNRMVHDGLTRGIVHATGNAARPLVHVEDVASAILHFLTTRSAHGIYNIVGENERMLRLGETVAGFLGVALSKRPTGDDARDYMASASKAVAAGWTPTHSVAGSLPVLAERTYLLPAGRTYERLPIARRHLGIKESIA